MPPHAVTDHQQQPVRGMIDAKEILVALAAQTDMSAGGYAVSRLPRLAMFLLLHVWRQSFFLCFFAFVPRSPRPSGPIFTSNSLSIQFLITFRSTSSGFAGSASTAGAFEV